MSATILIVEDEKDLVDMLVFNLERAGYRTLSAASGRQGIELAQRDPPPDLVLLDLMLPDMSGMDVCRELRASDRTRGVMVVMLTAKTEEIDRVVGFEVGADDYVTKPFSVRELLLRIKAMLRRRGAGTPTETGVLELESLRIDPAGHRVWVENDEVTLTALEFRLLTTLVHRKGRVQTRDTLLSDVWGMEPGMTTRTVDTHVLRLRKKLGVAGDYVETIRGVGYRFRSE